MGFRNLQEKYVGNKRCSYTLQRDLDKFLVIYGLYYGFSIKIGPVKKNLNTTYCIKENMSLASATNKNLSLLSVILSSNRTSKRLYEGYLLLFIFLKMTALWSDCCPLIFWKMSLYFGMIVRRCDRKKAYLLMVTISF